MRFGSRLRWFRSFVRAQHISYSKDSLRNERIKSLFRTSVFPTLHSISEQVCVPKLPRTTKQKDYPRMFSLEYWSLAPWKREVALANGCISVETRDPDEPRRHACAENSATSSNQELRSCGQTAVCVCVCVCVCAGSGGRAASTRP